MITLHDYQNKLISDARSEFQTGAKGVLMWLATGGGKTVLAAYMISKIASSQQKVWFVVHREELIKQTIKTLTRFNIRHGVMAAGWPADYNAHVQICSIMSIKSRYTKYQAPSWIFWDECQFMGAKSWSNTYNLYPSARHIGLSATPVRLDGKGFDSFFNKIVHGPSINWLISNKFLSDYTIFAPTNFSTDGIKKTAGDFDSKQIAEAMNKPTIIGDCFEQWSKYASKLQTIAFSPNILFSEGLVDKFKAQGVNACHVDGTTPSSDREKIIQDYSSGKIQFLSNCNLFTEGFDVPNIGCILDAAPTMSIARHLQKNGRGLRTAQGKDKLIVLDQWNGYLRHGLIDDERDWSLEGRNKTNKKGNKNEAPTKRCPTCFAANSSFNAYCTNCGTPFEIKKRTGPDQIDGDLAEVDKAEFRKMKKIEERKAQSLEELIEIGVARGYKNPAFWAKMKFNNGWRGKKK